MNRITVIEVKYLYYTDDMTLFTSLILLQICLIKYLYIIFESVN